jgi:hypothetical protein
MEIVVRRAGVELSLADREMLFTKLELEGICTLHARLGELARSATFALTLVASARIGIERERLLRYPLDGALCIELSR